jgi:TonB family protein
MLYGAFILAAWLAGPDQASSLPPQVTDCSRALASPAAAAAVDVCQAEEQLKAAEARPPKSTEWTRHLQTAAGHLRRAANLSSNDDVTYRALDKLSIVYDAQHLDRLRDFEAVLNEMIGLRSDDMSPVRRLVKLMEDRGLIDAAEELLMSARRRQPLLLEPVQMLAQFYIRRSSALQREADAQKPPPAVPEGEPDANGVYRVGGALKPPAREGVAQYPEAAMAAQVEGAVVTEIVVDTTGAVIDARIVRSIPELDEAALRAVQKWRFEPTMVNGKAVPVRMTTTVNFTLPVRK